MVEEAPASRLVAAADPGVAGIVGSIWWLRRQPTVKFRRTGMLSGAARLRECSVEGGVQGDVVWKQQEVLIYIGDEDAVGSGQVDDGGVVTGC